MFDLSLPKLLVLAVIALVVFGPNELPKMAAKAGKALRELRRIAEGAKADLREGLGPEFADFDIDDLNPRHFVQKHLLSDLDGEMNGHGGSGGPRQPPAPRPPPRRRAPLRHRSDIVLPGGTTPRTVPPGGTTTEPRTAPRPRGVYLAATEPAVGARAASAGFCRPGMTASPEPVLAAGCGGQGGTGPRGRGPGGQAAGDP